MARGMTLQATANLLLWLALFLVLAYILLRFIL